MGELGSVPELLARSDRSFASTQHRMRTIKFWILGIFGCLYFASLAFGTVAFVTTWHDGDWLTYWAALASGGPLGVSLARIALWEDSRANLFAPVADLRQAIRDGDQIIAPVAQSSPAGSLDVSGYPSQLGPLRRPAAAGTVATFWGIAVLVLLVPCIGVPLTLSAGNGHLALLLAVAGFAPGLVCIYLGWRLISPLWVRVEPDGLRWRRPLGLRSFVAWRDAKSFFALTYARPLALGSETLYVLDGGTVTLVWRAGADVTPIAALHPPSLQLHQLITQHTGLPLRDVSARAKHIAPAASMLGSNSRPSKEEVRHRLRVAGVVLSPFLILALISLGAQLVQTPYFEHLYAQAHAHAALYRDPLTHADGDWPDNSFSFFDHGVYHFQRSAAQGYLPYVVAPHRYDHALVEVSGRTGGTANLGGVGLAISGPSGSGPLLTFRVAPDGSWWLERLPMTETDEAQDVTRIGDMSAIHQGFGVSNQIAVLLNGSDFTFYVNGRYATGYHDDALKGGEICLYLDVTSDSGEFSNFAVYPL